MNPQAEVGGEKQVGDRTHHHPRRAEWVAIAVVGILLGAAATSVLARSTAGGAGVAEPPTVTGILTAEKTAFVETPSR